MARGTGGRDPVRVAGGGLSHGALADFAAPAARSSRSVPDALAGDPAGDCALCGMAILALAAGDPLPVAWNGGHLSCSSSDGGMGCRDDESGVPTRRSLIVRGADGDTAASSDCQFVGDV